MATRYYEDVELGAEIPPLKKTPTTQQLVQWAGASGDFTPIHYDRDIAQSRGLPGVIVHGLLKYQFLLQMLNDWIGQKGRVRSIAVRYLAMSFPGEELTCRGTVEAKREDDGLYLVDCHIWLESVRGEQRVSGRATVSLPSRMLDSR